MNTRTPPNDVQILVVDDEPDLRALYELALVRVGYCVVGVGNLGEARELLARQRFDVVVTDMRLPDGLGTSLLHLCRDQHRTERCVVITAYGSAENAVESLKTGAFDYLTKPVDVKQFRAVVASAVQGARGDGWAGRRHAAPRRAAVPSARLAGRLFARPSPWALPAPPLLLAQAQAPVLG